VKEALLQTKLYIPATRHSLVARPHLLQRLTDGLPRRLTLVSAPAGFGKTTLVARWAQSLQQSAWQLCWLSLDENDNDLVGFFTYVVAALRTVEPDLGGVLLEQLHAPGADNVRTVVTALINDLAATEKSIVLALDDYHLIADTTIHEAIRFLLENGPPNFHLLLITRADPPFSLARLRARQEMTEIRQDALRLAEEEAHAFLNQVMALDLSTAAVSALEKRTEGWLAGLQMAALSMQGRANLDAFISDFTGSHRYIFDYLAEEVLLRCPPGTRDFLLQTAVLERLCAPLCDAVLEREGSQSVLEQLEAANLFLVPLDDRRRWYRYHHLFADLLRQQLKREKPGLTGELHTRASRWFEASGYADEAVQHALAAADYERAARLVTDYSEGLMIRGEISKLLAWIDRLPALWQRRHPELILSHAWSALFRGSADEVEVILGQFPDEVASAPPYAAYLLVLRGTVAVRQGRIARAIELSERAAVQLAAFEPDKPNLIMRGANTLNLANAYRLHGDGARAQELYEVAVSLNRKAGNLLALMNAFRDWGVLLVEQTRLRRAEAVLLEGVQAEREWARELAGQPRKLLAAAPLHVSLGKLYYEWNRLDEAQEHLVDAVKLLELSGPVNRSEGLAALALLRLAQGEAGAVPPLLEKLEALQDEVASDFARQRVGMAVATTRCALYRRQPSPELRAAVERSHSAVDGDPELAAVRARLLLALERPAEALSLLETLIARSEEDGRKDVWLTAAVLRCLAHHGLGDSVTAVAWLRRAVEAAETGGYVRLFLDAGRPLRDLLAMASQKRAAPPYAAFLLDQFGVEGADGRATGQRAQPLADALSPRETEVLQLVAQGLTNKEIAAELVIAPSTAKRHTINIYNKLGVNNRAEATARAYELGIVS